MGGLDGIGMSLSNLFLTTRCIHDHLAHNDAETAATTRWHQFRPRSHVSRLTSYYPGQR